MRFFRPGSFAMTSKRIFVIYTGGTLGMQPTPRGYQPLAGWLEQQLRQLPELQQAEMPDFVLHEYAPLLDSSDMQPADWQTIAADIHAHYDDYDGFVVLHGTDTMAYSAAAVQCLLPGLGKPVIFTGSQIPLAEAGSDAPANIRNALYAAAHSGITQVGIVFHRQLLPAEYATKVDAQGLAAFAAPNAKPLLEWKDQYLNLQELLPVKNGNKPELKTVTEKKIAVLTLHPGMDFELTAQWLAHPWDAVILQTFGSGNAPQHPTLLTALTAASARGVRIVNRSQCARGTVQNTYSGAYALAECGVVAGGDQTLEMLLARLMTDSFWV